MSHGSRWTAKGAWGSWARVWHGRRTEYVIGATCDIRDRVKFRMRSLQMHMEEDCASTFWLTRSTRVAHINERASDLVAQGRRGMFASGANMDPNMPNTLARCIAVPKRQTDRHGGGLCGAFATPTKNGFVGGFAAFETGIGAVADLPRVEVDGERGEGVHTSRSSCNIQR